tara:strand:- start:57 stop:227 length:171 start_codon:yes stop_codon:yes gene_type:complete
MNGASADPSVRTINKPKRTRKNIIGASSHFFLSFNILYSSYNIEILDIIFSLLFYN